MRTVQRLYMAEGDDLLYDAQLFALRLKNTGAFQHLSNSRGGSAPPVEQQ